MTKLILMFMFSFCFYEIAFSQVTPPWTAKGEHRCQSVTDIGHTCTVSDVDFVDCDVAAKSLKLRDCCPSTKVCSGDPGNLKCKLGGTSQKFTVLSCLPFTTRVDEPK